MCVIAIKGYGVEYPTVDRVKTMCRNNPNGFAMCYYVKGAENIRVFRTMNKGQFIKEYEKVMQSHGKDDVGMFIHARISTHGSTKIENCHGFVDKDCGICFAHNGMLSIQNRDDMTDSETFFRDLFIPAFSLGGWVAGDKAIQAVIGYSKFVFMDATGHIRYYGNFIQDKDGCFYSNGTYQDYGYGSNWCKASSSWGGSSKKGNAGSVNDDDKYQYSWWDDEYDGYYDGDYYGH